MVIENAEEQSHRHSSSQMKEPNGAETSELPRKMKTLNDDENPKAREKAGIESKDEHPRKDMKHYVWIIVLCSTLSSYFLYALDDTCQKKLRCFM